MTDQEPIEATLAMWRKAVKNAATALEAANAAPSDPDINRYCDAATQRVRAIAREAWARPVSGPADLRLRAEIAQHCLWGNYCNSDGVPRFEAVLSGENAERYLQLDAFDERAVAELVKAVLWTGQAAPAQPEPEPARAAPGNSERGIVFELEHLIGRAREGVTALDSLWDSRCGAPHEFPDQRFAASLRFCLDALGGLLEQADRQIEAAINRRSSG